MRARIVINDYFLITTININNNTFEKYYKTKNMNYSRGGIGQYDIDIMYRIEFTFDIGFDIQYENRNKSFKGIAKF
jgi:hypothetical protein